MLHNGPAMLQNIPALTIFVVVWLLLKLIDYAESYQTGWTPYILIRLVIVLVALLLILLAGNLG